MSRFLVLVGALLLTMLVGSEIAGHRSNVAERTARAALDAALSADDSQKKQVAFLTETAARAKAAADSIRRARPATVVKYVAVRDSAPADCQPVIEAADQLIASGQAESDSLRSALGHTEVALDSVRASLGRLRPAAVALEHASRPSLRERLTPKLGFGAAVGVDPLTRRPATAIGMTLGWTF
jgi:hypothetical protein